LREITEKPCGYIVIFRFFQQGGRLPSLICLPHIWTALTLYGIITGGGLVRLRDLSVGKMSGSRVPHIWTTQEEYFVFF